MKHTRLSIPRTGWLALAEGAALFVVLAAAIWLSTQSRQAPQVILLTLLTVIAVHFSIPWSQPDRHQSTFSPVLPVLAVAGLLVVGPAEAFLTLAAGFLLAFFSRSLWRPLRQDTPLERTGWAAYLILALLHLLPLLGASLIYQTVGGQAPLQWQIGPATSTGFNALLALSLSFSTLHLLLVTLYWGLFSRSWLVFAGADAPQLLLAALVGQPFALFGAITFSTLGLPAFVIFGVGVGAFAIITWLLWQRHYTLERHTRQFATLNDAGITLRETLEISTVLERTYDLVSDLVAFDYFSLALREDNGKWRRVLEAYRGQPTKKTAPFDPDNLTLWVANEGRVLALDPGNMHFAPRHGLALPSPLPASWLGVPLLTEGRTTGVLVLQRFDSDRPFSRWSREVLLALAGQISAAIQNANLYREVVRLYNLTDQALADRLRQLQALLNSVHEGVLMLDRAGRVTLVNPQAARLLDQPVETLRIHRLDTEQIAGRIGYDPADLFTLIDQLRAGDRPAAQQVIFITYFSEQRGAQVKRHFIQRSEDAVFSEDGQLLGWLMVFRDVTEEQERAEWRTNVTRMIVHDLRNPVTTLLSTIDMLEGTVNSGDIGRLPAYLQTARHGCQDMLDMIDSLMDMTRLEAGQLDIDAEAMRLPALLEQVTARLQPLAQQRGITLRAECPAGLPAVWADSEMARRILVNLLDNALKFTPEGGSVHIALAPARAIAGYQPGVRCTVTDSGPGIPAEYRSHIFERFIRVNAGGGQMRGTGLGLTFCKLAVEAHDGRIWIEDAPEGGSRFIFTLPGIPEFEQMLEETDR